MTISRSKIVTIAIVAILVGCVAIGGYILRQRKPLTLSPAPPTPESAQDAAPTTQPGNALPAPTGQLLSKSRLSLSSTDPTKGALMTSVCQTIPHAVCDIRLISNTGAARALGAQPTSSGVTTFHWSAKERNLTPGIWTAQAIVTQGEQIGTSHTETLEVLP